MNVYYNTKQIMHPEYIVTFEHIVELHKRINSLEESIENIKDGQKKLGDIIIELSDTLKKINTVDDK